MGSKKRAKLVEGLRELFICPTRETAIAIAGELAARWRGSHPQVAEHVEGNTEGCLACLSFPASHRKRIRATDGLLERFDQEIKRRTRVVRIFPNREACLRLVAVLAVDEQSEEWVSGRRCLNMEELLQAEWEASGVKREEREVAPIIKRR